MSGIVVSLLLFTVCLVLLVLGARWYLRSIVSWLVESRHRQLEYISSTGAVPEQWSSKYNRRMAKRLNKGDVKQAALIQVAAYKSYSRKLQRLQAYAKSTNLVESEQVRSQLIVLLQKAGSNWQKEVRLHYEEHGH